jgi:hypothetical protein
MYPDMSYLPSMYCIVLCIANMSNQPCVHCLVPWHCPYVKSAINDISPKICPASKNLPTPPATPPHTMGMTWITRCGKYRLAQKSVPL